MISINLRLANKPITKSLIAALAPLPRVLGRYREARKSLRGSISQQSRQGLDWMNFFLADVQTAFGAFVAFYLADLGWSKGQVGLALTVGTLAGVISQIPGGALADAVRWKRDLAAVGIGMLCVSALILGLMPSFALVFFAEILHGLTEQAKSYHRIFDLGKNRKLYIFAACVFLFQLADASLLPVVGENLAQSKTEYASILMAGLIVVPQIVVALLSPWVGFYSEK